MAIANPNLAFLKYWGKKDIEMNIPSNSSISINLDKLYSKTTVVKSASDVLVLNGNEMKMPQKMIKIVDLFRERSGCADRIAVKSENNFPEACGMASSASGYAALVLELNEYFKTDLNQEELSEYARRGSGSASRSIFKGLVLCDGTRSHHIGEWKELKVLSIQLSRERKKVSSTEGMIRSAETSYMYKRRLEYIESKIEEMKKLIGDRDFPGLAKMIMVDSNQLHAVCMDSYPPIRYITDEGFKIIEDIHELNKDTMIAAYSFDAGPNPFVITLVDNLEIVKEKFKNFNIFECN